MISFDSSKHDALTELYKAFRIGLNIAKRKPEGEGTSTSNKTKKVRRSGGGAKQLFPKECTICKYSGAIKIKYKKQFPRLLTVQTSANVIVRFANIKEHQYMLKIVCNGKLLEREFMAHDKCYKCLPTAETVRCLKFHIKNTNTKYCKLLINIGVI